MVIVDILRMHRKRCDLIINSQKTINAVIGLQRFVKAFFKRLKYWQALLVQRMKKEVNKLIDFFKLMRPPEHKKEHEWFLNELLLVNEDDMKKVCSRMI